MSLPPSTESAAMLGQPDLVANPRALGNERGVLPDAATGTVLPSVDALFLRADLGDAAANALGESYIGGLAVNLYGGLSPKVVKSRVCRSFNDVIAELARYAAIGNLHMLIHGEADAMGIGPLAGGSTVSVTQFHDLLVQAARLPQVTSAILLDNCRIGTPPFLGTSWTLAEINTKGDPFYSRYQNYKNNFIDIVRLLRAPRLEAFSDYHLLSQYSFVRNAGESDVDFSARIQPNVDAWMRFMLPNSPPAAAVLAAIVAGTRGNAPYPVFYEWFFPEQTACAIDRWSSCYTDQRLQPRARTDATVFPIRAPSDFDALSTAFRADFLANPFYRVVITP